MDDARLSISTELDPADWEEFSRVGKRMIDDMISYIVHIRDRPVWQPIPEDVSSRIKSPLPITSTPLEIVYEEFCDLILPYPRGNIHPRFWGWVNGSGLPVAAYADFLASMINATLGSGENAPMQIEDQVIEWLKEAFDWPCEGSGVLTSGCSMGQIIALSTARTIKADWNVREKGNLGKPLTVYASSETHHSIEKALELIGFGSSALRQVPTNTDMSINTDALIQLIHSDREEGLIPICIVANAGTVNTGAIDNIEKVSQIAKDNNLWLHVDGAFGAFGYLLDSHKDLLSGINKADSLVFDLHKWLYLPFDVSCILVRHPLSLEQTFSSEAGYISRTSTGPSSSSRAFSDRGIEQSRRFRALKIWFALKTHGLKEFKKAMSKNVAQIQELAVMVRSSQELEIVSTSNLNIMCFRYRQLGAWVGSIDDLNRMILGEIQDSGTAMPSHALILGRFVIRVAINNHRTNSDDLRKFVDEVIAIGNRVAQPAISGVSEVLSRR